MTANQAKSTLAHSGLSSLEALFGSRNISLRSNNGCTRRRPPRGSAFAGHKMVDNMGPLKDIAPDLNAIGEPRGATPPPQAACVRWHRQRIGQVVSESHSQDRTREAPGTCILDQ